ncbi:MAG: DASS family sodium-coupled anion symporter [Opitutae bacterium]|nr:DASS family sodium-coupled anion symporter [Opitutae bacterium]
MPIDTFRLKNYSILLGLAGSAIGYYVLFSLSGSHAIAGMAATAVLMGLWWITQALPLASTSLMPVICYPLFGIRTTAETAQSYMNPMIMLFIGGFLIAVAMQRWNLHKRIALHIISWLGSRPQGLVLGFMLASAFLSMWISNTATAMMMVSIGLAVISQIDETIRGKGRNALVQALMLSIAYGCSSGGVATLVGTPTNLVFISLQKELFPDMQEITFGSWILLGLPLTLGLILLIWTVLTQVYLRRIRRVKLDPDYFKEKVMELPPMSPAEKRIASIFLVTCLLWIFRKTLVIGSFSLPGWSTFWEPLGRLDDGVVAVFMATLLFVIPAKQGSKRLLEGKAFFKIPWNILLLISGGFALAGGFIASGLSEFLAGSITGLAGFPPFLMILAICLGISFLTELTSNVATVSMFLPILAALAPSLGIHPYTVMIPATIAASMAFMMPVATPPNAIVFSSGKVTVPQMAKFGFWLNLLTGLWVVTICQLVLPLILPEAG